MHASRPDCKHYLAEDLCAALPGRPEEHCCSDEEGECARYVSVESPLPDSNAKKNESVRR
jgi:hypothetical protein